MALLFCVVSFNFVTKERKIVMIWKHKGYVDFRKKSIFYILKFSLLILVLYSTLLHLPPLRFHCAYGCWDRTQELCQDRTGALVVRRSNHYRLNLIRGFLILDQGFSEGTVCYYINYKNCDNLTRSMMAFFPFKYVLWLNGGIYWNFLD